MLNQRRQLGDRGGSLGERPRHGNRPIGRHAQLLVIAGNSLHGLELVDRQKSGDGAVETLLRSQVLADPRVMLQGGIVLGQITAKRLGAEQHESAGALQLAIHEGIDLGKRPPGGGLQGPWNARWLGRGNSWIRENAAQKTGSLDTSVGVSLSRFHATSFDLEVFRQPLEVNALESVLFTALGERVELERD